MLLPIKWLKQFVTVNETAEQVAERFIELGFECEVKPAEIIDLEITPNRGDCLSILGLAREYAAATAQEVKVPALAPVNYFANDRDNTNAPMTTISGEQSTYHRLSAIEIKNINVTESPAWLKEAVESVGMNSISPLVDLTNYVMFELGMPMHAFDLDLIGNKMYIRLSTKGETFISLKDEEVKLPEGAIVVEADGRVIDLLGIRGGKSSMISPMTKNTLVWAASVPRPLIRKAAKETGIRTEGAYRHERETDWQMTDIAIARFVELFNQLGEGEVSDVVTLGQDQSVKKIELHFGKVNQLLGTEYDEEAMKESLRALGFTVEGQTVTVPSWRYFDINFEEDLIEEIARIQGYTKLPHKLITATQGPTETIYGRIENLKDQLVAAGLTEVYTESFSGREDGKALGWQEDTLDILANPVNRDFAYCRPAISPHLIKLLALNSWADDAKIFEVGNVFPSAKEEVTHVAIAAYGKQQKLFAQWVPEESISVVTPEDALAKNHKLRRPVTVAEVAINQVKIPLTATYAAPKAKPNYQTVSVYPPSVRDISMIVSTDINPATITKTIHDISPESIILVELFDQFQSDKFGPNKQSLAFHVVYQDPKQTLEAATVDATHKQVIDRLVEEYQAEIR